MDVITNIYRKLVKYDGRWSRSLGLYNPYADPYRTIFTSNVHVFDKYAYEQNPDYRYVYDKLWVANNQGLESGTLEELLESRNVNKFPIFIKPRWGNTTSSSKNCYKINSYEDAERYSHIKGMMWSSFIDGRESMTDYILVNGRVVYQITYMYSEEQIGFVEVWKYIDSKSKTSPKIDKWVRSHMSGYTGIVNIQSRDDFIIEVSLRPARGGSYLKSTRNETLIKSINKLYETGEWDVGTKEKLDFKPYYSFKCHTYLPVLYLLPQPVMTSICRMYNARDFYEYYFEPAGNDGMVFYQLYHDDYDTGLQCKKSIERIFITAQLVYYFLFLLGFVLIFYNIRYSVIFFAFVLMTYITRFINPININYSLWKVWRVKFG